MQRKRRPRSGPDSVWRILRRLARKQEQHEEWRRRFDIEERARQRAFRQRLEEREAAARRQEEGVRRQEEASVVSPPEFEPRNF